MNDLVPCGNDSHRSRLCSVINSGCVRGFYVRLSVLEIVWKQSAAVVLQALRLRSGPVLGVACHIWLW